MEDISYRTRRKKYTVQGVRESLKASCMKPRNSFVEGKHWAAAIDDFLDIRCYPFQISISLHSCDCLLVVYSMSWDMVIAVIAEDLAEFVFHLLILVAAIELFVILILLIIFLFLLLWRAITEAFLL